MSMTAEKTPVVPPEEFGTRVYRARKYAGLGSAELSTKLGMAKSSVAHWESGMEPRNFRSVVTRIAEICGVDPVWLAFGDTTAPPPTRGFANKTCSADSATIISLHPAPLSEAA